MGAIWRRPQGLGARTGEDAVKRLHIYWFVALLALFLAAMAAAWRAWDVTAGGVASAALFGWWAWRGRDDPEP